MYFNIPINSKTIIAFMVMFLMMFSSSDLQAQLDNPDWGDNATSCVPGALLYPGVAVVTCGVVEDVPVNGRYVMAFMALNNAIPTSAPFRADITDPDSALHHSDWLVSNIGNVFGTAINQATAEVFVTASSNYGAGFGFLNNSPSVLNYGSLGSPANATEAAGTVYRMDPITGAASVFARLPQQTTTVAHWDCEDDAIEITRNNTGVGLGNIAYDELNDQYFVTNTEDGRIYRLSNTGVILDSYDPLTYDTGVAGIDNLEEVPYGIAVEPGSNRLFFGFVDDPGAGPSGAQALPGAPEFYSVDLNSSGGFVGTVDNTTMPAGATYDNYVGTDQLHGSIPTSQAGGGFSYTDHTIYFISDMAFAPDGTLLVSVRSGCHGSWHSSYNHWAETDVITLNTMNNLYDTTPFEYDITVSGDAADEDEYGGVATYELTNATCDVHYAASSSDVLSENGPHGIAIWDAATVSAPVSPLGVFEYGVLPSDDPKGIGGDVEMYNGCNNSCNITGGTTACEGQNVVLTYTPDCPSSIFTWSITSGDATIVGANDQTTVTITAGATDFTATVIPTGSAVFCTHDVMVTALGNPSIDAAGPFCIDGSSVNLSASPSGGTFSGTGITDGAAGTFDPAIAGIGTHTITYSLPGICMESTTADIEVTSLPVVSISGAGPFCVDESSSNLTASPSGGTFSGTGITDGAAGTFDPATAGAGTHTITYTYMDMNGCTNSANTDIVVNGLPAVSITGAGPFCIDESSSNLAASPSGGTYSGTGITDGAAGTFDPATAGAGTHTVTYTYMDMNGCTNSANTDIVVNALPTVSVSGGPFCIDDAASNLTASPSGGMFSGTGITDGAAGTFDPATAGLGTHTITYTYMDGNGCTNSANTDVVVNDLPTVSVSGGPFCLNSGASNLPASPTGGMFSGAGITDASAGTFDPAVAGVGTHTITYDYMDMNGCTNSASTDVEVFSLPVVNVSGGPFCIDEAATNLSGTPTGGTYSGDGITDTSLGTFDPAVAGVGTHTIRYDYIDMNGCLNSAAVDVDVFALPTVTVSGGPYCINEPASNLTGSPVGGTFSGTGITDASAGTFDPVVAGLGTHTITYDYIDMNGCTNSATTDVVVNDIPTVTLSGGPFCEDNSPGNLNANPTGGTFSGTGITDASAGTFDPSLAGVGTHTITYVYMDMNGCTNSTTADIEVNGLPVVNISDAEFCVDAAASNMVGTPTGGTYSGTGITDGSAGTFDPAVAGVGTHTVSYDYEDANGCLNSATTDVEVYALPVLTLSGGPFCIDAAASNLPASPAGGTYSGTGITDASAGTFDPAVAGIGTHTITYDYMDINGCTNSTTTDVVVNPLPVVSVSGGPFCVDAAASNLPASPVGGMYSGTGITDASAGTFDPAVAGVGTHTITYDYMDINGCTNSATTDVVVNPLPVVSISGGPFCIDAAASNLPASPVGGTYSGTGITDASAGTFDPAVAGVGTHTITYDYMDMNGCTNSATTDVVVNPLPVVSVSGGPFCIDAAASNLPASPVGGTYSGMGITDASAGTFDPAVAGVGTHTITYDYMDMNGCTNSATTDVVVNPLPVVSVSGGPFCVDAAASNLPASPTGGAYSGPGIIDASAGTFDPAVAGVGTHTITYDYMDMNGCTNSATTDVFVNPLPTPSIDPVGTICIGNGTITMSSSPTGGTYSGPGVIDVAAGIFDPKVAGLGTHTITYGFTDINGCFASTTVDIEVINCFDLALSKTIDPMGPQGPFVIGDNITFIVSVYNQGQTDAINVVVEDYLPSSMSFVSSPDFELVMGSYLDTIAFLPAGASQDLSITLQLDNYNNVDVINNAEIIEADDDNDPFNPDPEDQDSDLDSVIGSSDDNSETDTDDDIDDEDPGQPGTADNPADQDDYDPSVLPILDLANTKSVDPVSLAAAGGTFEPNEDITFEVNVLNQGNVVAEKIVVTDTIPCGLLYNNAINTATGWVLSGTGGSATFTVASLAPGADTTILITFSIKSSLQLLADCTANPTVVPGEPFTNFTYITSADVDGVTQSEDVDSDFDSFTPEEADTNPNEPGDNDTSSTGNNDTGSQDDNDPALVEIFDLALSKIVSPLDLPYQVGETVTFEICVSSQGNVSSDLINIIDYIPAGLEYNTASDALGWTGTPGNSTATFSFVDTDLSGGTLDFGEQVCVDIILTILSNQVDFVNRAEITSANAIVHDGMGGMVTNLVTSDNDSSFDSNPADEAGGAEDTASDAITNDIDDPAVLGNGTGTPGDAVAATDDDSADPALVPIVDFALRKKVADGNSTPFAVGDTIRFLIEVLNQGNVGGTNITINDYIPSNLAFVDITANDDWAGVTFGQSGVTATTTLSGPIEPGEIDSVYIELEILSGGLDNEDYTNSAEILEVFAAPSAPTGITPGANITSYDVDSTPDTNPNNDNGSDASSADSPENPNPADDFVGGNGLDPAGMPDDGVQATDEDDADPALVAFHDVALTKTKPFGLEPVDIGQVVTFTITVHNQGSSPIDSVSIIDYVPAGFSFAPNNNWVPSGMNATLTATIGNGLLPVGGIPVGGTQDFPIDLTVAPTATLDNLVNVAEITGSKDLNDLTQDDDYDSTADTIIDNDAGGSDDTPSDDQVNGDGTGTPGDGVASTDEDDSDPEGVELALYSIGNQVWLDNDNRGTINGSEPGIENVVVELYDAAGLLVESTLTDASGFYLFDTLVSGDYTVVIPALNFNAGNPLENLFSSTGGGQTDLLNGPFEDDIIPLDPDTNAEDNDDNGVLDANPLYPGAVVSTAITLGGPIDEPINEVPDNDPNTVDENENLTVDFGFVPLVSIGSNVFIDNNNDGIDDGDGGISGITVEVYDAGPDMMVGGGDDILVGIEVTDVNGDWMVDSLLPGNYFAVIPNPDTNYPVSSTPTDVLDNGVDGNDNGSQGLPGGAVTSPVVNLAPNMEVFAEGNSGGAQDDADDDNGDMTVDFGFPPLMSIGSTVFYDQNDNGIQDLADPLEGGIEGVQVELFYDANNNGLIDGIELTPLGITISDADGNYYFGDLLPGNYQVGVPTPDASAQTSSTGQNTTDNTDLTDDGDQAAPGGPTLSPMVNLEGFQEPVEDGANPGADQDDANETNGNMTVDFGFIPQMSIGSTVFYDPNDNGVQDTSNPLEDGIEGVTVNLYFDADGDGSLTGGELTPVMTTVTDAEGDYYFGMLPEGDYVVGVTPTGGAPISSTGQFTGDGEDGNDNGDQPGGSGTEILSNVVNLDGNAETHTEDEQGGSQDDADENNGDMTVDFGLVPNMSIGSTVFYDQNDDGVQDLVDPLEGGIEGVQVDLYYDENNDGSLTGAELSPVASTTTDADGNYYFGNLPEGNFQVGVPTPDASAQTSSTGQNTTDNEDLSDDGDQPVSGGATLSPIINLSAGLEPVEDGANPGADQDDANETNGNMTVDFGFIPQMSIGSTVFYDPNDNGVQDTSNPLEDGIEGVTVNLYLDADGDGSLTGGELTPVMTTVTDAEGDYYFGMLPEGDYVVGVTPTGGAPISSTGQFTGDGEDGNDNGDQPGGSGTEILSNVVNLDGNAETHTEDEQGGSQDDADENNGDMTVDFGLVPNMSIGSTVFLDNNDDGYQDPFDATEVGISGVTVELLYDENNDGNIDGAELIPVSTIWTDANGDYFFGNLPEGNYQVVIPTAPANAPTSSTPTDNMDNGEDGDDNGTQVGGAGTAVSSPIINLTATTEPLDAVEDGQGGMQDNSAASPDENGDMTIDFGFIPYVSVGSNVFVDENNDGIDQGSDEEGIEGVSVEVYSTGPDMTIGGGDDVLVGFDVTDVNGDWLVDSLTPGEYYAVINNVHPTYPTSSTTDYDADDAADNNDNGVQSGGSGTSVISNEFTLTGNAETTLEPGSGGSQDDSDDDNGDMTIDFGFVPYYSLGNQVWIDDNYDGLINGSETGIDGVDVELYDTAGNLIDMTVTMNGGMYLFDSLLPGDYIVVIPASELAANGTLQDYQSSTGTFNMGGIFETPGVDAETNVDNDDNGTLDTNIDYPDAVVSTIVTLGGDDEPLNENPDNDPNTLDQYENLTVDFGFIRKVYDIALIKETDMPTGNVFGDDILFTITVTNQGNTPLTNIEVTDYIAPGFETVPALNSGITDAGGSGWVDNGTTSSTYVIGDVVMPNETREIRIYLRLVSSLAPDAYTNYAEVSEFEDTIGNSTDGTGPYSGGISDEDSTPDTNNGNDPGGEPQSDADDYIDGTGTGVVGDGVASTDEDDHDPAIIQVVDIALAKTVVTGGPYEYGQEIEFNIEVINQGNENLENILITDYIPCGFTFGPSNIGWTEGIDQATYVIPALDAGQSTDISIYFTIIPISGSCGYDDAYTNYAEVSQMWADYDGDGIFDNDVSSDDADSQADSDENNDAGGEPQTDSDDYVDGDGTGGVDDGTDTTDEDDHDPAFINIFDLAQIKYIDDLGPYDIGTTATFVFEVTNQGNVDAYNIEITDYLSNGFGFSPIGNAGWSEVGDNLEYTISGPLAPGETETITLDLTVLLPTDANVLSWYNESEISDADDDTNPGNGGPTDADSTMDDDPDNDNDLVDGSDDDPIFDPDDDNDNVIDENPNDPFGLGDDDEDDNDGAGILVVGGLGDTVWKDVNGNGIQDPGEVGVEGVIVTLTDCAGNVLATQTTDADGFYFFNNLLPGDYQVQFDISNLPAGCTFTQQDQGGDDALDSDVDINGYAPCTNIQGGEYDSTFDAGLFILPNIGDFVWHDLDGDGIQDFNEPGIPDVMVLLYNEDNELVQVTLTDQDGYYLFPDVYPDTYYIVFVDPEGYESTFPNTTDDENDSDITNFVFTTEGSTTDLFTIVFGQEDDLSFDAGYYICIPIGELAWYDVDEDDVWDSTENGINGLEVKLYRLEGGSYILYDETVTGHKPGTASDDGYFKFCAPPGTYYIEMIMPPIGLVQARANEINNLPLTHPNEPTTDSDLTDHYGPSTTASFSVLSGEMLCNIGAGFYPMATAGNKVWVDSNENGIQDPTEGTIADVVVEAYEVETGQKVAESVTNNLGIYKIEYLQKKDYYLKFIPPSSYGFTIPNTGAEDSDSDVDHSYGYRTTGAFSLQPGEDNVNIDAGLKFGALPVVWTNVAAEYKGDHNLVTWTTASEVNTDVFVIERSLNGDNTFEAIGEVDAAGESVSLTTYEFKDVDVRPATYYYRIKQIDRDGKFDYSDIVSVTIESDKNLVTLAPNPAHGMSRLSVNLENDRDASVKIFGSDGRLIRSYSLESTNGEGINTTIEIDDLPTGVYSVNVSQGTFTDVKKLIILE